MCGIDAQPVHDQQGGGRQREPNLPPLFVDILMGALIRDSDCAERWRSRCANRKYFACVAKVESIFCALTCMRTHATPTWAVGL